MVYQALYILIGSTVLFYNTIDQSNIIKQKRNPHCWVSKTLSLDMFLKYKQNKEIVIEKNWYDIVSLKIINDKVKLLLLPDKFESKLKSQLFSLHTKNTGLISQLNVIQVIFISLFSLFVILHILFNKEHFFRNKFNFKIQEWIRVIYSPPKKILFDLV